MDTELMREVVGQPWAILASALDRIAALAKQDHMTAPEVEAALGRAKPQRSAGAIAVIPIVGVIRPRPSALEEMFDIEFGTNLHGFMGKMRAAVGDEGIKAIVLAVDSPGGSVYGLPEAAQEMRALRGSKPIIAVADNLMASAAYWLASQADEIVATPSSMVGSIGVIAMHEDITAMAEQMGIKVTLFATPKFKTEGHPLEPLTDDAKKAIQSDIDGYYSLFVNDVAKGRNVSVGEVRGGYGEGRALMAADAKSEGLADSIATMRETIARLGGVSDEAMRAENSGVISEAARRRFQLAKRS